MGFLLMCQEKMVERFGVAVFVFVEKTKVVVGGGVVGVATIGVLKTGKSWIELVLGEVEFAEIVG